MKTYEYRGFDKNGRSVRGLAEALSVKHVREKLADEGVLAEKISVSGSVSRMNSFLRAVVYRQLSSLLGAGIPLEKALDLLIKSPDMRNSQVILAGVRDMVREGASLASAFSQLCESVTTFETAIIEAAERSATVDIMLGRLADFIEDQEKLKSSIVSALLYPSIVVCLALIVAVAVLGFLVPWYRDMLAEFDLPMPASIKTMAAVGSFVGYAILPVVILSMLGIWKLKRRLHEDLSFRARFDSRLFELPLIGKGYRMLVNLRFARTMAILLNGGVSLIDSLLLSGRASGSAWIAQMAEKESESLKHGMSLSQAVGNIPPLSDSMAGWISTGEASGELEVLMDKAGLQYQEDWNRYTARALTLLEPMLILFVALFVMLLILPVLMSVINLSGMVGS